MRSANKLFVIVNVSVVDDKTNVGLNWRGSKNRMIKQLIAMIRKNNFTKTRFLFNPRRINKLIVRQKPIFWHCQYLLFLRFDINLTEMNEIKFK